MPTNPVKHRWGVKYSTDIADNLAFLQTSSDNNVDFAREGELFLNETLQQLYYVHSTTGVAKGLKAYPSLIATLPVNPVGTLLPNFAPLGEVAQIYKITLTEHSELLAITNPQIGQKYLFLIYQDNVGFHVLDFPVVYKLKNQIIPLGADGLLTLEFLYDGTNFIGL